MDHRPDDDAIETLHDQPDTFQLSAAAVLASGGIRAKIADHDRLCRTAGAARLHPIAQWEDRVAAALFRDPARSGPWHRPGGDHWRAIVHRRQAGADPRTRRG